LGAVNLTTAPALQPTQYEDMSTTHLAPSLSLSKSHERDGANGLSIAQAFSEWIDNSFDAGALTSHTAYIPLPGGRVALLYFDYGHGATELLPLYGIGASIRRKQGGHRGLKNYGHKAAMGRFAPDHVTHISRAAFSPRASTLIFNLGHLYAAIDKNKSSGQPVDYRRIDETIIPDVLRATQNTGLTEEIRDTMTELRTAIAGDPNFANAETFLNGVLGSTILTYHGMFLVYATAPDGLLEELKDAINSYRLIYNQALITGHAIELMAPAENSIRIDRTNAIDPLGSPDRIRAEIQIRHAADATYVQFSPYILSAGASTDAESFWFKHAPGDKIFFNGRTKYLPAENFYVSTPPDWESMTIGGDLTFACSVLSAAEDQHQKHEVGSSIFKSREDMCGVYLQLMDRYLGLPVYNATEWTPKRNAGALRIELGTDDAATAERYMGVQTRKHCATYGGMAPALQLMLNWLVERVIIAKYSSYKADARADKKKGTSPGVTEWSFPHFCRLIVNTSASEAADTDTESETGSESTAPPPTAPPPPAVTSVGPTKRTAPMSVRQFAAHTASIVDRLHKSNLATLAQTASTDAAKGLTPWYKTLQEILTVLEAHGLTYSDVHNDL
jgi:hypothetical protein